MISLEDTCCPLGCERNDELLFYGSDRLYGKPGEFGLVRCRVCGLIRTNPRPTAESIGQYYPAHYGPYLGSRVTPTTQSHQRSSLRRFARWIFRKVVRFNTQVVPELEPGRMLEIGCAAGNYLAEMQAVGWTVEGIEFSDQAAEEARRAGFNVRTGSLETATADPNSYDLIVGWMVLEHLHEPIAVLKKLGTWAKPGGWLCLSVPNCGSLEFKIFRSYWYDLHVPNHLIHLSPRTARSVLEKAGWEVERIFHQRNLSNLVGSLGLWLEGVGAPAWLSRRLKAFPDTAGLRSALALYPLAWLMSLLGQTGRMTIWARRAASDS